MNNFLDKFFELNSNKTSIRKEILAGFTTFITMSYIVIVNPQIMSSWRQLSNASPNVRSVVRKGIINIWP